MKQTYIKNMYFCKFLFTIFIMENFTQSNPQNADEMCTETSRRGKQPKPYKPESRARKFWRVVFGSALGFIIASVVIPILAIISLVSMVASDAPSISSNSVLELTLNGAIVERANNAGEFSFLPAYQNTIGLDDVLSALRSAAKDSKIKGVSLYLSSVQASPASMTAIRHAITEFKKSGKFVYAYGESYSQGAYYIASAADQVYLNPKGNFDLRGMASQIMFYKGLIDKLDIEVDVVKCGKFKSAVEPYLMDRMSEANREQMEVLLNSIWGTFCQEIAASRKISVEDLNRMADSLTLVTTDDVLASKLVDKLIYRSDYGKLLREKVGIAENAKLSLVYLGEYIENISTPRVFTKDKIAVVYAYGEIVDGKGGSDVIASETFCKELRKVYKDKKVKAIVLRVNSPGGSALASEVIWNEIEQAKAAGKKVVVSMGDYAASGGYYISSGADAIFAEATTLTGSIGVFGMIPSVGKFLENKLGITIDRVKTNEHADALSGFRPMDEAERAYMQNSVDETYDTFLSRVAAGRKMHKADVDSIGQGRVWSGKDAVKLGLVDKIGNLDDAIKYAANLAQADDYAIVSYPVKNEFWAQILAGEKEGQDIELTLQSELGDLYPAYHALRQIRKMEGIQARMPMDIMIK